MQQKEVRIYQLVLFDNGFDFHYIVNRDKTELNEKLVIESADHSYFRRKDGLNIKSIDLHNYLQVEKLPSVTNGSFGADGLHVK